MVSFELREQVSNFIQGQINVTQFEDWLIPRLPCFIADINSEDSNLIAAIELGLAEYHDGNRTEDNLHSYLSDTLKEWSTHVQYQITSSIVLSSSNTKQEISLIWEKPIAIYQVEWDLSK
jgi:hypothetical protein